MNPAKINFREVRLEAEVSLSHPVQCSCVAAGSWAGLSGCAQGRSLGKSVSEQHPCWTGRQAAASLLPVVLEASWDRFVTSLVSLQSRKVVSLPLQALGAKSSLRGQLQVDDLPCRQMGCRWPEPGQLLEGRWARGRLCLGAACSSGMCPYLWRGVE